MASWLVLQRGRETEWSLDERAYKLAKDNLNDQLREFLGDVEALFRDDIFLPYRAQFETEVPSFPKEALCQGGYWGCRRWFLGTRLPISTCIFSILIGLFPLVRPSTLGYVNEDALLLASLKSF